MGVCSSWVFRCLMVWLDRVCPGASGVREIGQVLGVFLSATINSILLYVVVFLVFRYYMLWFFGLVLGSVMMFLSL